MFSTQKRCLIGIPIWGYQNFYSLPPKNWILSPKPAKFGPKLAFWPNIGIFGPFQCPIGCLVVGCGARAVSRKTSIYFMTTQMKNQFTDPRKIARLYTSGLRSYWDRRHAQCWRCARHSVNLSYFCVAAFVTLNKRLFWWKEMLAFNKVVIKFGHVSKVSCLQERNSRASAAIYAALCTSPRTSIRTLDCNLAADWLRSPPSKHLQICKNHLTL